MNIQALKELRRVLAARSDEEVHMKSFEHGDGRRCALGWCSVDPWFREHTNISQLFGYSWFDFADIGAIFGFSHSQVDQVFFSLSASRTEILAVVDGMLRRECLGEN